MPEALHRTELCVPGRPSPRIRDERPVESSGRVRVLIVDDEPEIRTLLARSLSRRGHDCRQAASSFEALEMIHETRFDAILSDIRMPQMSGLDLLCRLRKEEVDAAILMITADQEAGDALRAIKLGADDYIVKPFQLEAVSSALDRALERRELKLQVRRYQENLEWMLDHCASDLNRKLLDVMQSLVFAVEANDPFTDGHARRVAWLGAELGSAAGLSDAEIRNLQIAGVFHDVGKIGIHVSALRKTTPLTAAEYAHIKAHPEIGARILEPVAELRDVVPHVLHHHECFDGSGYPHGLEADQIPLGARIIAVADAFDAMISKRPYRPALPVEAAIERLENGAGGQFDPALIDLFVPIARCVRVQHLLGSPAWAWGDEWVSTSPAGS